MNIQLMQKTTEPERKKSEVISLILGVEENISVLTQFNTNYTLCRDIFVNRGHMKINAFFANFQCNKWPRSASRQRLFLRENCLHLLQQSAYLPH